MNYLVVALGNPGEQYAHTRHNAGWLVLDFAYPDLVWEKNSYAQAVTAERGDVLLAKPMTFMNESGITVDYFIKKEHVLPEQCIVVYDDIDLPLGKIKISFDRGSGGHNGIKSIESYLGSREFIRIRIGISKVLESGELVKPNVLGNFEADELEMLKQVSERAKKALDMIITEGKDKAASLLASF